MNAEVGLSEALYSARSITLAYQTFPPRNGEATSVSEVD